MVRAFVALPVDAATEEGLAAVTRRLAAVSGDAVRWVRPGGLHLTLQFLGEIAPATLDELAGGLRSALGSCEAPELRVEGLGTFPERGAARVIWAGVAGGRPGLEALAAAVEGASEVCGVPREARPFHPHLTLGRVRRDRRLPATVADALAREGRSLDLPAFRAGAVVLFRSRLRSDGAEYEALARFVLREPAPRA